MSRIRDIRGIAHGARSGLEGLLGRLTSGAEELAAVDARELAAELEARRAGPRPRRDANPLAAQADGSARSRLARQKAADARAARIHAERDRKSAAERAAQEAAFRRARAEADAAAEAEFQRFRRAAASGKVPPRSSGPGRAGSGSARGASSARARSAARSPELAKHYRTLNLEVGAEWSEVRAAYRKLMRKYHPDLHNQSPKKLKAATELSMQVTAAYHALEKHLRE